MDILQIKNLRKDFFDPDGKKISVIDIPEFKLSAGQLMGVRGRSGTGKTTFLHLLAGILREDSGEIVIDSQTVSGMSEASRDNFRAQKIGYIFQNFHLIQGMTALENVLLGMYFGSGPQESHARELLAQLGLSDRMHFYPAQLSTGQQQRVALARALAGFPKLVLADEPTGNLDPHHAKESVEQILKLCRQEQAALLLVSHDEAVLSMLPQVTDLASLNVASRVAS